MLKSLSGVLFLIFCSGAAYASPIGAGIHTSHFATNQSTNAGTHTDHSHGHGPGPGGYGHGWGGHGWGGHFGIWPLYFPGYFGYPLPLYPDNFFVDPISADSFFIDTAAPVEFVEMTAPPADGAQSDNWYYCKDPDGYYPYVKNCPGGWQSIPSKPPK